MRSQTPHSEYYIHTDLERRTVETWSIAPMPHDPKGWKAKMAKKLRAALATLPAEKGDYLSGLYISHLTDGADAENVLFYNVEPRAFKNIARHGVKFERGFRGSPEPPAPEPYSCYTCYEVSPKDLLASCWIRDKSNSATWSEVPFDWSGKSGRPRVINDDTPAGLVWLAIKECQIETDPGQEPLKEFWMELILHVPTSLWNRRYLNLTAAAKPLFDGSVAALHSHTGSILPGALEKLKGQLKSQYPGDDESKRMLRDPNGAVLGPRHDLVRAGGNSLWNPRDDDCVVGVLKVAPASSDSWALSGTVAAVVPVEEAPEPGVESYTKLKPTACTAHASGCSETSA